MSFYGQQRIPIPASNAYVYGSLIFAMSLALLFSPWHSFTPNWVGWVVAWWSVRHPKLMSMGLALSLGLLLDVVYAELFGVSMLELLLISYVMGGLRYRFEIFSFLQQSMVIGVLFFLVRLPSHLSSFAFASKPLMLELWLSPILSGLLWSGFSLLIVYPLYRPVRDELNPHKNI